MPQPDFWIRKDDTQPRLEAQLIEGTSIKQLGGKTVQFTMEDQAGNLIIDGAAAIIVSAGSGICAYEWQPGDSATPGRYFGRFYVVEDDETFPNYTDIIIQIYE